MDEQFKTVTAGTIIKAFLGIVGILVTFWALNSYIEHKIENKLNDPDLIRKIAAQVRPSIIFDSRGRILMDMGGMQYLQHIKVEPGTGSEVPQKIIVTPKEYMKQAPLLENIDLIFFDISVDRGVGITWEYKIENSYQMGGHNLKDIRFRLEIVP